MVGENTMEVKILGQRRELDKWLAFAAANAHQHQTVEYFTACGRSTTQARSAYEVGTVDRDSLMKAYVLKVYEDRTGVPVLTQAVA